MKRFTKAPAEVLPYRFDWSLVLGDGETITSSSWTVAEGLAEGATSSDDTSTTITLSGGTLGTLYALTNTIVTSAGLTHERSVRLSIAPR